MPDQPPVQHTPKHLQADSEVFDVKHPAASAFAPAQPAAGVVANDADEKGQNLAGAPKADDAQTQFSDQKEVLAQQHQENLVAASGAVADPVHLDGEKATPAPAKKTAAPKPS